jgi:hypothetical protein
MAPKEKGANTKKESGKAKKAENESKKREAAAAEKVTSRKDICCILCPDTHTLHLDL